MLAGGAVIDQLNCEASPEFAARIARRKSMPPMSDGEWLDRIRQFYRIREEGERVPLLKPR